MKTFSFSETHNHIYENEKGEANEKVHSYDDDLKKLDQPGSIEMLGHKREDENIVLFKPFRRRNEPVLDIGKIPTNPISNLSTSPCNQGRERGDDPQR